MLLLLVFVDEVGVDDGMVLVDCGNELLSVLLDGFEFKLSEAKSANGSIGFAAVGLLLVLLAALLLVRRFGFDLISNEANGSNTVGLLVVA